MKQGFEHGTNFPQFEAVHQPVPPYYSKLEAGLVGKISLMVDPSVQI